ncbi:MAG: nucleoside-diphosphate kinase [bacterium]
MLEKTLLLIKPDGVARGLENEIIKRVGAVGLKVDGRRDVSLSLEEAAELYKPHVGKSFYDGLIKFITSGAVTVCLVSGEDAIARIRTLMGATDPLKAEPGSIRGDLKEKNVINEDGIIKNIVHGSDSPESAERELAIFFS